VRREMGPRDSASGRKYLREFGQAFRRYDAVLTAEQLNSKIAAADVLLIGDYHALPASQRFAAQLIEQLAHGRPVVLGLESVLARDQRILDAWWRREIGEQDLRQRLRFDREWGYDWDPCYELLTTARDHTEGIYGLDCMPRDDLRRIGGRDRHAAAKICEMREEHPNGVLVVLFGESHMAPQHLPRVMKEAAPEARIFTVLQNVDALYWQAVEEQAAAVSIGDDAVCVFNSSPLEKYESYRLCFERWNGTADDLPDFAPAVYNLIFSLTKSLGFRLDSPRNGTQPKFLADSLPEVVSVKEGETPSLADEGARTALEERGCVYVSATNTFFIREFQMAQAAEESSRFLHHACRGMRAERGSDNQNIEDALAHFGSRLLCPAVGPEGGRGNEPGEALYRAYIAGGITRAALRRAFLARVEDPKQAQRVLALMKAD
jgi:Haem-binding uptake, Tiki superfamily, ChaN